jgi:hypothetical protein
VKVASRRNFTLSGYVNTSKGKVTTTVTQTFNFANNQRFDISSTLFVQDITLTSNVNSKTTIAAAGQPTITNNRTLQFPLNMDISQVVQANGNINQTTKSWQNYGVQTTISQGGKIYIDLLNNSVMAQDTLELNSAFQILGNMNQSSSQLYNNTDTNGLNQFCILTAANNALTAFTRTCSQ